MTWLFTFCLSCSIGIAADGRAVGPEFWAYQPMRKLAPPPVSEAGWPRSDVDRFIRARLDQEGLQPAADADRTTLIRRLYFDLIGLPPTVDEIDQFLHDDSPDAVAAVVDRLLASRHFGERWGRHWLDVARYADSSGGGRSLLFPNAWRYRDYVIDSINRDKPFDQFIREQIAGDLLPYADDSQRSEQLIATAFLMIGAHNYELQDKEQLRMDVVDEQIESVGRAFLGQTLGCARCHDHKFDPIPTTDYYALAGIFRSTKSLTPGNVSGFEQHELPVSAERRAALDSHAALVKTAQDQLDGAKAALKKIQTNSKSKNAGKNALLGLVVDDLHATLAGAWTRSKHNPGFIGDGYIHDGATGKGEKSVTFQTDFPHDGIYEVRLSYTHGTNRSPSVPVTVNHADDQETVQVDQRQPPPIDGQFIALGRWRFRKGMSDAALISNEGTTGHVIVDAVQFIPIELLEGSGDPVAKSASRSHDSPESDPNAQILLAEIKQAESEVKKLEGELKKLKETAPPPAPATMGVKDEKEVGDYRVCIRGNVHDLGAEVPRGFLSVASKNNHQEHSGGNGPDDQPAEKANAPVTAMQSGRQELAEWLVDPSNPLTARVAVNRIWHHMFGTGLVRTVDNFGSTGESPSHPELLDWLAVRFIELGWSQKQLIRELVLSRSYQMASHRSDPVSAIDPANRLLARQNRKRMDAECLRDAMLLVGNRLDMTAGGQAIQEKTESEYGYKFDSTRRSVYSPVFRNNLPDIFDVFDFANPNTPTGQREVSTLPSQALYLMNSPFVLETARHAAESMLELDVTDSDRIVLSYRRVLGRRPTDGELQLALSYVQGYQQNGGADPANARLRAWSRFYHALFASVDFRYVH